MFSIPTDDVIYKLLYMALRNTSCKMDSADPVEGRI